MVAEACAHALPLRLCPVCGVHKRVDLPTGSAPAHPVTSSTPHALVQGGCAAHRPGAGEVVHHCLHRRPHHGPGSSGGLLQCCAPHSPSGGCHTGYVVRLLAAGLVVDAGYVQQHGKESTVDMRQLLAPTMGCCGEAPTKCQSATSLTCNHIGCTCLHDHHLCVQPCWKGSSQRTGHNSCCCCCCHCRIMCRDELQLRIAAVSRISPTCPLPDLVALQKIILGKQHGARN